MRVSGIQEQADLVLTSTRLSAGLSPDSDLDGTVRVWTGLVRPGGHVAVVVRAHRSQDGELVDIPTAVIRAAVAAGLVPVDRCVALVARIRGTRVLRHTSRDQVAHRTVLVFKAAERHESQAEVAVSTQSEQLTRVVA
ncbi:hypothetical protein [Kibdelosporangium aridum]|uniref:hypothetical protein n=1 Tax=Kibdelosporangium aridum TaxID=2030 RepID=UPI0035EC884B